MMGDMHIRNLRQKSLLRQRTEEAVKKLQVRYMAKSLTDLTGLFLSSCYDVLLNFALFINFI
jgi:hypothetical protein